MFAQKFSAPAVWWGELAPQAHGTGAGGRGI